MSVSKGLILTFDDSKTLDELEGIVFGSDTFGSYVSTTYCRARTTPVRDLSLDELRLVIGQGHSDLEYVVPVALKRLMENPWLEGRCYEGDLIFYVLRLPVTFWQEHADWRDYLDNIVRKLLHNPFPDFYDPDVLRAVEKYREKTSSPESLR